MQQRPTLSLVSYSPRQAVRASERCVRHLSNQSQMTTTNFSYNVYYSTSFLFDIINLTYHLRYVGKVVLVHTYSQLIRLTQEYVIPTSPSSIKTSCCGDQNANSESSIMPQYLSTAKVRWKLQVPVLPPGSIPERV